MTEPKPLFHTLIASGLVVNRKRNAHALARHAANDFSDIPAENRPGLIVVLADNDTDASSQAGYWQDVVGKGFGGKYLVALAVAPQWQDKQSPLWLTRRERGTVKTAPFTTETLAAEIVRDAETRMPINAAHVFLAGVGAGGVYTYDDNGNPTTYTTALKTDASNHSIGNYTLTGVPAGTYDIAVRSRNRLHTVLRKVMVTGSATTLLPVTLFGGDANNDNVVDIADFGALINAYNGDMSVPDSG